MPEQIAPPVVPDVDIETAPFKFSDQTVDDAFALKLVTQTFSACETWRHTNHDFRWNLHDMLYFGNVEKRVWEGTNIPRASLANQIVFDQVESAYSSVHQALFGGDKWFDVVPGPGGEIPAAREVEGQLLYALEHAGAEESQTAMTEVGYALKNTLQYGNGYCCVEFDEEKNHAAVQWVDLRDIYIDTGNTTPSIDTAKYLIHRRMMTVEELDRLRDRSDMKIPPRAVLNALAKTRTYAQGDRTKQVSEAQRGVNYLPGADNIPIDPTAQDIEVLVYWSRARCIWVLNRVWTAYNEKNKYGIIPYVSAPCYNVVGRHYAQGIADVIGDTQLYMQALWNLRLDELHLAIMPPRVRKNSTTVQNSQLRWRPGMLMEMDNPKEDLIVHYPNSATAHVADEIERLGIAAEKRTGVNALGQGVPRPSNANRTLGGMQMQMQGAAARLHPIVEHIETYMLVPLLYKVHRVTKIHANVQNPLPVYMDGAYGETSATNFLEPVKFIMRASRKMMTRDAIAQMFPYLAQYLFAGPFLSGLSQLGQTVDFAELLLMLQDATGVDKKYQLVRPMNDQEKEAMKQPDPQTQAKIQLAQMDAQIRTQMGEMKHKSEMTKHQLDYQARSEETEEKSAREMVKVFFAYKELEIKQGEAQAKAQAELQKMYQKLSLEQQKSLLDMIAKDKEHKQKLQQTRELSDVKIQTQRQQTENDLMLQQAQMSQGLELSGAQGVQKLRLNELLGEQKIASAAALRSLSGPATTKAKSDPKRRA